MNLLTTNCQGKLSIEETRQRMAVAEFVQPVLEHLTFPDQNLQQLGFWNPVPIPSQGHVGIHLLNKHGEPVMEIHGLACSRDMKTLPAHTGFVGSWLFCMAEDAVLAAEHRPYSTTPGNISPIGSRPQREEAFTAALAYMTTSHNRPVRYTTPLSVTLNILEERLKNFKPSTAEEIENEPIMVRRRRHASRLLRRLPDGLLGRLVSLSARRRIRRKGHNSNAVAHDMGLILRADMQPYSEDYTPWVTASVAPWLERLPKLPARPTTPAARSAQPAFA